MNILSNMIRRIKPIISIMIILLVVFIVYNIVFRQRMKEVFDVLYQQAEKLLETIDFSKYK